VLINSWEDSLYRKIKEFSPMFEREFKTFKTEVSAPKDFAVTIFPSGALPSRRITGSRA
jgi:hypothetical protein